MAERECQGTHDAQAVGEVEAILQKQPEVVGMFALTGFSLLGNGANLGQVFAALKPWEEREGGDEKSS